MTVFLVRHGSAGVRNDADPDDLERHLDEVGLQQAQRLAVWLGGNDDFDGLDGRRPSVRQVLSSSAARCVETVAPLAAALGTEVQIALPLLEGSDIDSSWDLVEKVAANTGDTVVCSHGDVIPEIIRRARLRGMTVTTKSGCSKGSIWALQWDGERFDTGAYTKNH